MSTADRLLSTLQIFTPEQPEWLVETAAARLGTSTSTMYRYFNSLADAGFLDSVARGRYVLGPAFIAYDRQIRMMDPVIQVARPVMRRLLMLTHSKGVALLCRRLRRQIMCVHQEHVGDPDLAISYERGRPLDMFHGASSKVILAYLPPRTVVDLFRESAQQIEDARLGATLEEFRSNLKRIRSVGISVTRGEIDSNRVGIAAPIFSQSGVVGSISMVLHDNDAPKPFVANVSTLVQAAAREVDAALADFAESQKIPDAA